MVSQEELTRRLGLIQQAMKDEGYEALVFVSDSYVSHKGGLRYVFGYNLQYRRGFGVVPLEGRPTLVLPEDAQFFLRDNRNIDKSSVVVSGTSHFHLGSPAHSVVDIVDKLGPSAGGIGLVYADEIMHAGDFQVLMDGLGDRNHRDASELFDRVRRIKSPEEMEQLRDANRIAEMALKAVEENVRVGKLEREIGAEAYRAAFSQGTTDTLFLTWRGRNGDCSPQAGLPSAAFQLEADDVFIFSVELDNPAGFFVELSRIYCLGEPSQRTRALVDSVKSALQLGEEMLKPGISGGDFFRAVRDLVSSRGHKLMHIYQGHSIGQDIVERPYIHESETWPFEEGMAVAFHPFVVDQDAQNAAYMANTYLVSTSGGQPLSSLPLDPYIL